MNDRDHSAIADDVSGSPPEHIPRYFAKSGHVDADPKKTKKDGGGKGNWGRSGDEVHDYGYTFTNSRRRSNSSTHGLADFKTKFETREPEPVFEEAYGDDRQPDGVVENGSKIERTDSNSSGDAVSAKKP